MNVWTREVTKNLLGAGLGPLSKILAVKICQLLIQPAWAFIKLLSSYKEVHAYQKVMEMFAIMNYLMKHPMSFTYPNSFLERHNVDSEFCQREVA